MTENNPTGTGTESGGQPRGNPQGSESTIDWKSEARKWEERAKASHKDSIELKKLKESTADTLSKLETLQSQNEQLTSQLESLKTAGQVSEWKTQVSKETGVPVDVLRGSTLEEIQEHAKSVSALLSDVRKPQAPIIPQAGQQPSKRAVLGIKDLAHAFFGSQD